jgi:Zn-dependent M16 (insulinase) family peptidase
VARFVELKPPYSTQLAAIRKNLARRVLNLKNKFRKRYLELIEQKTAQLNSQAEAKLRRLAEAEANLQVQAKKEAIQLAETLAKEAFVQMFTSLPSDELKQVLLTKLAEKLNQLIDQKLGNRFQDFVKWDVENLTASIQVGSNLIIYDLKEEINSTVICKSG